MREGERERQRREEKREGKREREGGKACAILIGFRGKTTQRAQLNQRQGGLGESKRVAQRRRNCRAEDRGIERHS